MAEGSSKARGAAPAAVDSLRLVACPGLVLVGPLRAGRKIPWIAAMTGINRWFPENRRLSVLSGDLRLPVTHVTDRQWRPADDRSLLKRWMRPVTITELIDQLLSLKAKHGDVACVIRDSEFRRKQVRGLKHLDSRPSPWKSRAQPFVEILS